MRILLPISHELHQRNWIASGAVETLQKRGHEVLVMKLFPRFQRLRAFLRLGSLVAREPGSRTYTFKLAAHRPAPQRAQVALWRAIRRVADPEALAARIEAALPVSKAASRAVAGADLVLLPTMIHMDAWDNDLLTSARMADVPVLAAPASWDTLTTKGGFLVRPDGLLVWGEASKRHALGSHGFTSDQVAITGPPQFDLYAEAEPSRQPDSIIGILADAPIILVAGTTVNYWADEVEIVTFLQRHSDWSLPVVHRPHPRAGGEWSWQAMLTLREQLRRAVCVIAAFSTVVIEASLLGKPSLLVGFGESTHGPGSAAYHMELEHMAEVASWPGVLFCRSKAELLEGIRRVLAGIRPSLIAKLCQRAQEVARSDGHARERIAEAVETFGHQRHF